MKKIFKKFWDNIKNDDSGLSESKELSNEEIIYAYNKIREAIPSYEPNYQLAEKVFREFNTFNLRNIEEINPIYLQYIPKSLLPYPKNYIKCAYYLYLESAKKHNEPKLFELIQEVGGGLFYDYPDYNKYKENLKTKKGLDNYSNKKHPNINWRESFKKLYGVYEVSEEDYYSSPSSIDSTNEKLIHDFGFLPNIENDVSFESLLEKNDYPEGSVGYYLKNL